ncbi:MAG: DUF4476 domain-containing protein [Chitinophagales bacterium]|nr:DUF4476 domain-containing protein [Chitinophagales bacterium]
MRSLSAVYRQANYRTIIADFLRKMIVLAALMVISYIVFARLTFQPGQGILHLRMNHRAPFSAVISGIRVDAPQTLSTIINIPPGRHFIQVYAAKPASRQGQMDLTYSGYVDISPNTETFATVLYGTGQLCVDDERPVGFPAPVYAGAYYWPMSCMPHDCQTMQPGQVFPINNRDFAVLRHTIRNAAFEDQRLNILRQAAYYHYFTSAQVAQLMNLFSFEQSRLEVAKMLYPRTLDPQHYYLLHNELTFQCSREELSEYIAAQRW